MIISSKQFFGTFDGQGHTVSGIYINNSNNFQGLFGRTSPMSSIKNVGIINSYIKGKDNVGGVVGLNKDTITNCYYSGLGVGIGGTDASQDGTTTFDASLDTNNIKVGETATITDNTNLVWDGANPLGADFAIEFESDVESDVADISSGTVTGKTVGTDKVNMVIKQNELTESGFTGEITTIPVGLSLDFTVTPTILKSITAPNDITGLPNGTAKTADALGLPATVTVATQTKDITADVAWDMGTANYKPEITTSQMFTVDGTVTLPNEVENPNNIPLTTSINVTVNKSTASDPVDPVDPVNPVNPVDPTPDTTYTPNPHNKTTATDKIADIADDLEDGDNLTIKPTNKNKSIKGDVLKQIKGKDINVKVEIADGIEWSFNGKDIPENWDAKEINFDLNIEKSDIPDEILKPFTDGKQSKTLSLGFNGEFGFEMTLTVHIGYLDNGKIANLHYYNPQTKELEFMQSNQINSAGNAKFNFSHASDYVILVSDKAEPVLDTTTTTDDDSKKDSSESNPVTGDTIPVALVIISLAAVVITTKRKFVK